MDIDQFAEIFGARVTDSNIRIPRAVERWFDEPNSAAERKVKALGTLSFTRARQPFVRVHRQKTARAERLQ